MSDLDPLVITALIFVFIGPLSGFYVFQTNFLELYNLDKGFESLIYIIILAVVCTA